MHLLCRVTGNCEHVIDSVDPSDVIYIPRGLCPNCADLLLWLEK